MSRVEELLPAFTSEFRAAGDADPRPYLRQVAGVDRDELAALIDHFLAVEPAPEFDPAAFATFRAEPARSAFVDRVLEDAPALLELRRTAGLTKAQVGARLAEDLRLTGMESAAKGAYHDIETGHVAPERVHERIWDALSNLYGASAEQLRRATRAVFEARPPQETSPVFTRLGAPGSRAAEESAGDTAVREAFFTD